MADAVRRFRRFDGELAPPVRMPNGWLKVEGKIARVGLQEYENDDGTVHMELRLPEEVFNPESMKSFQMVPVTNTHPPVMLDSLNTASYAKGYTGENVRALDETWVGAPIMVTDSPTIQQVESGRAQLSNGYECTLDPTQDQELVRKWGPYKFIQRNIRGNHVALVDAARAGDQARVRLDSAGNAVLASRPALVPLPQERPKMAQIRIDGVPVEVADASAASLQAMIDKAIDTAGKRADSALSESVLRADAAEGKLEVAITNGKSLLQKLDRIRKIWDAMKARMSACDECGGTGKVPSMDDAAKMVQCDFCDGKGEYRMHSGIVGAKPGEVDDEDMNAELEGEDMDEDELAVEQETETEAAQAHGDKKRKDAKKLRLDAAREFAEDREKSFQRRVDRAVANKLAMVDAARKHVPADVDLMKLDSNGIKLAVIKALSPDAKMDGKTDAQIEARYEAEIERAREAGTGEGEGGASDGAGRADSARAVARTPVAPPAGERGGHSRVDGLDWMPDPDAARANMGKRLDEAGKRKEEAK